MSNETDDETFYDRHPLVILAALIIFGQVTSVSLAHDGRGVVRIAGILGALGYAAMAVYAIARERARARRRAAREARNDQ